MNELTKDLKLKIKLVSDKAVVPSYATSGSCGLDLTAVSEEIKVSKAGVTVEYDTGIAVEIPEGYAGLVMARSSVTTKTTLSLGNGVGLIDSDYRGTIKFQYRNLVPTNGQKYKVGERIGQLLIVPVAQLPIEVVTELSSTNRGSGGFGSTGV